MLTQGNTPINNNNRFEFGVSKTRLETIKYDAKI